MMGTNDGGRVGVGQRRRARVRDRREGSIGPSRNDARRCVVASSSGRRSVARGRTERRRGRRRGGGRSRGTRPRGRESRTWSWRRTSRRVRGHARGGCAPRKRAIGYLHGRGSPRRSAKENSDWWTELLDQQNRPGSSFAPSVESIGGPRGLIAGVPEESINLTDVGSISEPGFRTRGARREVSEARSTLRDGGFHCERRARRRAVGDDARPLGPRPAQQETQHRPPRLKVHSWQAQGRRRGWSGAPPHHKGARPRPPPPPQSPSLAGFALPPSLRRGPCLSLTTPRLTPPAPTLSTDRRRRRQQG